MVHSKVKDIKENFEKCVCNNCLSYVSCMSEKKEGLFCSKGKSNCQFEKQGCICLSCPVYVENKLNGIYYCKK
jgi:hypothetical protein